MMMICKHSINLLVANHFLLANVVANVAKISHICDLFDEFASKNWSQIFASIFASKNRTRKAPENTDICDHGGRKYLQICHQDFSIDFFHIAHCDHHCIPHGPHLHSSTVITLGDDPGGRYTRIWVPWDPYWPC